MKFGDLIENVIKPIFLIFYFLYIFPNFLCLQAIMNPALTLILGSQISHFHVYCYLGIASPTLTFPNERGIKVNCLLKYCPKCCLKFSRANCQGSQEAKWASGQS